MSRASLRKINVHRAQFGYKWLTEVPETKAQYDARKAAEEEEDE